MYELSSSNKKPKDRLMEMNTALARGIYLHCILRHIPFNYITNIRIQQHQTRNFLKRKNNEKMKFWGLITNIGVTELVFTW